MKVFTKIRQMSNYGLIFFAFCCSVHKYNALIWRSDAFSVFDFVFRSFNHLFVRCLTSGVYTIESALWEFSCELNRRLSVEPARAWNNNDQTEQDSQTLFLNFIYFYLAVNCWNIKIIVTHSNNGQKRQREKNAIDTKKSQLHRIRAMTATVVTVTSTATSKIAL